MDEKLMQYLQEQFDKVNGRLDDIETKLSEYDHLLDVKRIRELDDTKKLERRISDLELDVAIIKKVIGNMR